MAIYDYKEGKKRIEEILDNKMEIIEASKVPSDETFTFTNGYYSWVTSIFVDIRNSSTLFAYEDKEKVAKVIRSFTSEVIEILRKDANLREIGIRGDCVYAVYTTPYQSDVYEQAEKTFYINTYMKMLNILLGERDLPLIGVGIGVSTDKELVIKAGRKGVDINDKVWIGKAVTRASKLSSLGNKDDNKALIYSSSSYDNFIEILVEKEQTETIKNLFKKSYGKYGSYYTADIILDNFNQWIKDGMYD